ncbi:hypothetical protein KKD52_08460 [Myxococcota bacterium]|jgi:hypothetical protein|nr:hypothetical protein [Myxococcota bacterium]MBU1510378.1 hypothetical protein [Myxococcota bacterium]
MKNASLLLTVSLFFALSACESMPEESSGSRLWGFMTHGSGDYGQHGRHFRGDGQGRGDNDFLVDGRGRGRHLRGDGERRGGMDRRGNGEGRRFRQQGMGPDMGMHRQDGYGRGMGRGEGRGMGRGEGRGMGRGEGRGMGNDGHRHMGPPAEALTACEGKNAGDTCSFVIEGDTVQSTCSARRNGDGPLACRAGKGTHQRHDTPSK